MKPIKNRFYCVDCHRIKMLFKTEAKALNFMAYNGDEILEESGKAPKRAYYCRACGGWHVTSAPHCHNKTSRVEDYLTNNEWLFSSGMTQLLQRIRNFQYQMAHKQTTGNRHHPAFA